ncbi:hypothetical protein [Leifsonia sp. NPDC058230]|uniref:hypothetical protein n=1 Tax=Leifsonia sp. NPDC058230 TaxID=3346391 RepID=UPI0036D7C696
MADAVPTAPTPRIRWFWWLVIGGALLVTVAAVALSFRTVAAYQNLPKSLVGRYLTDLEHGRAADALRVAGITTNSSDVLLTDAAFAHATDRIRSFTLAPAVIHGSKATVVATIHRGDEQYRQSFSLERAGGLPGLSLWKLAHVETDVVDVVVDGPAGLTFTIAGRTPTNMTLSTPVTLRAFPGTYPVKTHSPSTSFVLWDADAPSIRTGSKLTPTTFVAQLSSDGTAQARAAVDAWLDACVASTEAEPLQCPFLLAPANGISLSEVHWRLDDRPALSVEQAWTTGGWPVESSGTGQVSATATLTRTSDGATGIGTTGEIAFPIRGMITFDDQGAVFSPYFGGQQGLQG